MAEGSVVLPRSIRQSCGAPILRATMFVLFAFRLTAVGAHLPSVMAVGFGTDPDHTALWTIDLTRDNSSKEVDRVKLPKVFNQNLLPTSGILNPSRTTYWAVGETFPPHAANILVELSTKDWRVKSVKNLTGLGWEFPTGMTIDPRGTTLYGQSSNEDDSVVFFKIDVRSATSTTLNTLRNYSVIEGGGGGTADFSRGRYYMWAFPKIGQDAYYLLTFSLETGHLLKETLVTPLGLDPACSSCACYWEPQLIYLAPHDRFVLFHVSGHKSNARETMYDFDIDTGTMKILYQFEPKYCCFGGKPKGNRLYTYDADLDMLLVRATVDNRCIDIYSEMWIMRPSGEVLHHLDATLMNSNGEGIFLMNLANSSSSHGTHVLLV